jgi:hypothetical protein
MGVGEVTMHRCSILALTGVAGLLLLNCSAPADAPQNESSPGSGGDGLAGDTGTGGSANTAGSSANTGGNGVGGSGGTSSGMGGSTGKAGGAGTGGSSGGSAGSGGGGFVPPSCANGVTTLPSDAPKLAAGMWTQINPASVTFGHNTASHNQDIFTQGLAVDPCNPATIYLTVCANPVTGNTGSIPGLYRTTNAGATWTKIGPFDGPINIRIDPKDPKHLYANQGVRGDAIGFWVSTDGGATWKQPQGFLDAAAKVHDTDVYHTEVDPTDFNHVLLSFHYYWNYGDTAGVFESFDGGASFTIHDPIPGLHGAGGYGVFLLFNPALGIGNNKTWLFGSQGGGYYRTTDAGTTWTKVSDNNMEHGGGQIYYTKTGTLYSAGIPRLMKSTDNGATWQLGQNDMMPNFGYIGIIGDGTHLYTSSHDHDAPFVTTLETDGLKWTNFSTQISHAGSFEMAYDAANDIVYSANEYDGLIALKVQR